MLREKEMLKDIFVWRSLVDQISGKERLARGYASKLETGVL